MKVTARIWMVMVLACGLLLQGCVNTPAAHQRTKTSAIIADDNLDLLFATEFPVESKTEALAKANAAYRSGEMDKALFYSIKALEFDSSDLNLLLQIAGLHERLGNPRMAARAYHVALEHDPLHPGSLQGLGLLYFEAGQADQARDYLDRAVAGDSSLWRSLNALGVLADGRREFVLARRLYDQALEIQPAAVSVLINRGWSRYLAGDLQAAARLLYDVAAESDHSRAWRNLGMVYGRLGWYDDSLKIFRKLEDQANAYNRTGEIALDNQDLDVAFEYFSAALTHSPVYFAAAEENLTQVRKQRSSNKQ